MGRVEEPLEASPAEGLRLLRHAERLHHREPRLLPLERDVADAIGGSGIDRRPGLLCPAGVEQPLRDLGRDRGHRPRLVALLGDEPVDVALRVGDRLQRQLDGDVAPGSRDLVGVDRT